MLHPEYKKTFILQTDVSDCVTGAVLLQMDNNEGILHAVSCFSSKLKKHRVNDSTIEKELLGIVLALKKYQYHLHGGPHPVMVLADHNPLQFLEIANLIIRD